MPLAFAGLSERLLKADSKLAPGVLLYKMSSASPVPRRCPLARFHEANTKPGSSSKKNKTSQPGSPSPPRQPRFRFRPCGEVEGEGIIFDAGKEAPCFPFPLGSWSSVSPPPPAVSAASPKAAQPSPGRFLPGEGERRWQRFAATRANVCGSFPGIPLCSPLPKVTVARGCFFIALRTPKSR